MTSYDDGTGTSIVAGGSFTTIDGVFASHIAKRTRSGWAPLGSGTNLPISAIAVFDDGTGPALYAGGPFTSAGGPAAFHIAKWNGTSWSPVGAGANDAVTSLYTYDDGTGAALYVGGAFTSIGGVTASGIAKWNGTTWTPLGPGVNGQVYCMLDFDDGTGRALYVGGDFQHAGSQHATYIGKWDGAHWTGVGEGMSNYGIVHALARFDDGQGIALYAVGEFQSAGGVVVNRVAKWNGSTWSALGFGLQGGSQKALALGVFDDGSGPALYAGGNFASAGLVDAYGIAKWNGTAWSALEPGILGGNVNSIASFDDSTSRKLFVGGDFFGIGRFGASGLAVWDGNTWSSSTDAIANGTDGAVRSFALLDDGAGKALYATGDFLTAGQSVVNHVAKWTGTDWLPIGSGISTPFYTDALAVYDDGNGKKLYVGGEFESKTTLVSNIAKWDGTAWGPLNGGGFVSGTGNTVTCLCVFRNAHGHDVLYVGGGFGLLYHDGISEWAHGIVSWNGVTWDTMNRGLSGSPVAMIVFDDGSGPALYVAGGFHTAGPVTVNNIARWDGSSWSALGSGTNGVVYALAVHDDGSGPALYAAGSFTLAGGHQAVRLAKWNGSDWSQVSAAYPNGNLAALASFDDGTGPALYIGGQFTLVGTLPVIGIAKWAHGTWTPVSNGVGPSTGMVNALQTLPHATSPTLFVGGTFTRAGSTASSYVAEWKGCSTSVQPFCFGDGSIGACPCNIGRPEHGCANSAHPSGALLTASGTIRPDNVVLHVEREPATALNIVFQGDHAAAAGMLFGDGLLCTAGTLRRLYIETAANGSASAPAPGEDSITVRSAELGDPLAPGSTRYYQAIYRDGKANFCPPPYGSSWNVSNGVVIPW
jgi:hypothetical protein